MNGEKARVKGVNCGEMRDNGNLENVKTKKNIKMMKLIVLSYLVLLFLSSCGPKKTDTLKNRNYNDFYTGSNLNKVAFPIGGIGAGMFCLEGTGSISHMSVRNRPDIFKEPHMFAAISLKGIKDGSKVLEGQVPEWKRFGLPRTGTGSGRTSWGLPRFRSAKFLARFPFAYIDLEDNDIPLEVQIKGWSPFIPNDADNSSLPSGAIEYSFKNSGNSEVEAVFSYHSENFMIEAGLASASPAQIRALSRASIKSIPNGFVLSEAGNAEAPYSQGDFAIFTDDPSTVVDHCWFRGGWFDGMTMVWNAISRGEVKSNPPVESSAPGASLFVPFSLKPGETRTIRLMMAWYVPYTNLKFSRGPDTVPEVTCCEANHKPWYTSKFKDIQEVVNYWGTNYKDLLKKSEQFKEAFYASTLPAEVLEAVGANLTILKSPTLLRQYDGRIWGYEGCDDEGGCCPGSCTHVWNYAQAIPHLFPQLERTLRETEFLVSQNEEGHQVFRTALPVQPPVSHISIAAADGQLGGIIKVYRDWRISGDKEWLKHIYPFALKSLDYSISTWDPRNTGTLEEPQHNTYDIQFWGPNGMCTSFYLSALKAISEMGRFLGEDVSRYELLYDKGRKAMENDLWDGEYFIQKIRWQGLDAPDPVEYVAKGTYWIKYSEEALVLLQKEGPKYQYGSGCLSDGVLGIWMGEVSGLNDIIDTKKIESHLVAVHKYNFKKDLTNHSNPQRPGYALGNEGGLLLCTWPKGGSLSLPFIYSDEVWTGIEYQVASHLMLYGHIEKGLEIVRTCRDRYDGRVRNPFNEYECGHWYARALSSYALLQGLTGVRYDAVDQTLFIDSKVGDFTSFLSTATGFGTVGLKKNEPFINVFHGEINVKQFIVSGREINN